MNADVEVNSLFRWKYHGESKRFATIPLLFKTMCACIYPVNSYVILCVHAYVCTYVYLYLHTESHICTRICRTCCAYGHTTISVEPVMTLGVVIECIDMLVKLGWRLFGYYGALPVRYSNITNDEWRYPANARHMFALADLFNYIVVFVQMVCLFDFSQDICSL